MCCSVLTEKQLTEDRCGIPHQRGRSYNICQPLSSRGADEPAWGPEENRALAHGLRQPSLTLSKAKFTCRTVGKGQRTGWLGAQHAPGRGEEERPSPSPCPSECQAVCRPQQMLGPHGSSLLYR